MHGMDYVVELANAYNCALITRDEITTTPSFWRKFVHAFVACIHVPITRGRRGFVAVLFREDVDAEHHGIQRAATTALCSAQAPSVN